MAHLVLCGVEGYQDPAFVEIGGLGRCTGIDQHLCRVNAVGFRRETVDPFAKAGEHLTADLPAIEFGCRVRRGRAGHFAADVIDQIAGHVMRMQQAMGADNGKMGGVFAGDQRRWSSENTDGRSASDCYRTCIGQECEDLYRVWQCDVRG